MIPSNWVKIPRPLQGSLFERRPDRSPDASIAEKINISFAVDPPNLLADRKDGQGKKFRPLRAQRLCGEIEIQTAPL